MQVNVADMYTNPTILHCCRCPSLLWPSPFWDGVPMSSDLHWYTQGLSRGICMCVYDWGSTISLTWCSWTKWQGATWGIGRSCACIWPFTWLTSMQYVTTDRQQSLFFLSLSPIGVLIQQIAKVFWSSGKPQLIFGYLSASALWATFAVCYTK